MSQKRTLPKGNARACALDALLEWESSERYAHDLLASKIEVYRLNPSDRALAKELLFGSIRHLQFLDRMIAQLRSKGNLKLGTKCLLRIGLYQIFRTQIADHAAVNETVSLARKYERGLVNGILRNAIRNRDALIESSQSWSVSDRYSHPSFLIDRWNVSFGREVTESLCRWNNQPPSVFARVCDEGAYHDWLERNTGKDDQPEPVEGFPDFVRLPAGQIDSSLIDEGIVYIQDPSTSLSCWLLAPMPGEQILDACAAPGGKTSLLAAMSPDSVQLHASDSNGVRIGRLEENLNRLQIGQVRVWEIDWENPSPVDLEKLPQFDAILLDVPCSNTGVMRRRVDVRWRLDSASFDELIERQLRILNHAAKVLKPHGRIVYSTCSIDAEENQKVIESIGWKIEEVRESLPWRDGFDGAFAALLRPH